MYSDASGAMSMTDSETSVPWVLRLTIRQILGVPAPVRVTPGSNYCWHFSAQ